MMSHPDSKQTEHWKGPEGDAYTQRQTLPMANRIAMFERIFSAIMGHVPRSVVEFGANTGDNLWAIQRVIGPVTLQGLDPNEAACREMIRRGITTTQGTIQDVVTTGQWQMSMTRGVLIHIPPEELPTVYRKLYEFSKRYILIAEYYNPKPVEIEYRGKMGLLWKRDFCGELLDAYPDLKLADYGFVYHRDPEYPQDDVTWFMLEKEQR